MQGKLISGTQTSHTKIFRKQALLLGLVGIIVFFSLVTKNFFSTSNLLLIVQQASIVGIAGCAMTFVLIAGNFDLSMGATITLSVLLSIDLHDKWGPLPAVLIAVAACIIVGIINGYFIGYLKIHSLIVTLGMMSILGGLMMLYTGGALTWVDDPKSTWFSVFGRETLLGVPVQVVILVFMVVFYEFVLKRTMFGIKVQAVGGNASAVKFSGINERKIVMYTFVLSGLMAALAGIVMASRTMQYQTEIAFGYEFDVLAAVILGGASLAGGEGSVVQTLIGVLVMTSLKNGFLMIGLPYYFQWIVQGGVIMLMVWFDVMSKRKEGCA